MNRNMKRICIMLITAVTLVGCKQEEPVFTIVESTTEATTAVTETTVPTEATVETTVPTEETVAETTVPTEPPTVTGTVTATHLNIRQEPTTDSLAVGSYQKGDTVTILETSGDWGRTDRGWIKLEYVSFTETAPTQAQTTATAQCSHTWSGWEITKEATTTSTGTAQRQCTLCGKTESREIDKLPTADHVHSYTEKVTSKATCSQEGTKTFTCSCGDSYTESIAKTAHSYTTSTVAATCTAQGYTANVCKACGDILKSNYVAATGHTWGNWVVTKEATATATGIKTRTCSGCSQTEQATIPKTGSAHIHSYTSAVTKKATCSYPGIKTFTCSCGDSYTESISATGHSWGEWTTVTQPTANSTGVAIRDCKTCGESETKILNKLPAAHVHSYTTVTVAATCTTDGSITKTCSCGDVIKETISAAHSWAHHDEEGHYNVYLVCSCGWSCPHDGNHNDAWKAHVNSQPDSDRYNHSYSDTAHWVIDKAGYDYCTVCGATK